MKREIKFRGKRVDNGEWIIGDLNHIDEKVYIFDRGEDAPANSPDWFEVIPETVGQFTGLKDRNGKEIYENQDVKGMNGIGRVLYSKERAMLIVNDGCNEPLFHHNGELEVI